MQFLMRQREGDRMLTGIIMVLLVYGLIMLASASIVLSQKNYGENYYYLRHQLGGVTVGLIAFFIATKIHYKFWRYAALVMLAGTSILMLLVFIPGIGIIYQGASRWIDAAFFSFQPSELMKIAFIIYLARWLEAKRKDIGTDAISVVSILMLFAIPGILLILQPDIGTLLVILAVAFMMYFSSQAKISYIALACAILLVGLVIIALIEPYRLKRLETYFAPDQGILGQSYQINQSLIAIGNGGFFGQGIGRSVQKYNFLPEPTGDSIFAILAEELGFLGSMSVLGLFLMFLKKGLFIAEHIRDDFGRFLALGLSTLIISQAFINIMSISGIIPLTGIPLPFFSYGGSSLVAILLASGMLVNLSRHTAR